jgi:hypothetical protein
MRAKRVIICTALGLVAGVVCWLGSYLAGGVPGGLTAPTVLAIVFNRGFLGLVIGLSGWRAPWPLHGVAIGLAGSLPVAVYPLFSPEGFGPFLMYELAGGVWGFLIELGAKAAGAARE